MIEASERIGVSRTTINRAIREGLLNPELIKGVNYFTDEELQRFQKYRKTKKKRKRRKAEIHVKVEGLEPVEALAVAIIKTAMEDYKNRLVDEHPYVADIEYFFKSKWFGVLTQGMIEPEEIIESLKNN